MSFKEQTDELIKKSIQDSGIFIAHKPEIKTLIQAGEYFIETSKPNLDYNLISEISESIDKLKEAIK